MGTWDSASTLSKGCPPLPLFGVPLMSPGPPHPAGTLWGSCPYLPCTPGPWAASWPGHLDPCPPRGQGSPLPGESLGRGRQGEGRQGEGRGREGAGIPPPCAEASPCDLCCRHTPSGPHLACPSCVPAPAPPAQNVAPRAWVSVCSQVHPQLRRTCLLGRNEDRV